MNKKSIGAVIAVAGLASALGVNVYSKYRLLKSDNKQDKDSEVSKEELDDFNIEEMFNSEPDEDVDSDSDDQVDGQPEQTEDPVNKGDVSLDKDILRNLISAVAETVEEDKPVDNVVDIKPDIVEQNVAETIEDSRKEDDKSLEIEAQTKVVEEVKDTDIDINDPDFWSVFENPANKDNKK